MTAQLEILQTGPTVSIQDAGRPGFGRYGLSAGGAMDSYALTEGATLLGQFDQHAAIEMAGFGGKFKLISDGRWVALTGAMMKAEVDGRPVPWRQAFFLEQGQILAIGSTLTGHGGTYSYLHIDGGFSVMPQIGSIGTHIRATVGGLDGKALSEGQHILLGAKRITNGLSLCLPEPEYLSRQTLRIMWAAHAERFRPDTRKRLLEETFTISNRRDRMAMRLHLDNETEPFEALLSGLSDPVQAGDIQMTGDGIPAILIREHQPTGGYPRIATVIQADLDLAAQMKTGVSFNFALVEHQQAIDALKDYRASIASLGQKVKAVVRTPSQIGNLLEYNLIDGMHRAEQ